jgi:hypothetical protein
VDALLQDATAGSPMGGWRWTHKSLRKVAGELRRRGFPIGHVTAGRLLAARGFSLHANRKRLAGRHNPNRNHQFLLLARRRRRFLRHHWPIISVDSKKKELIGNFKNPGRTWRKRPRAVLDHDFPSLATGQARPYGIYDEAANAGYVVLGTSHDTPAFATAAIRSWWRTIGRHRYPRARRLAIDADSGGSNGSRCWLWKLGLQRLADECHLTISVGHLPTAASKWNPIEHRMFNLISGNWAGEPLTSYDLALRFIRTTRSTTGFHCRARLDPTFYPTKVQASAEQKASLQLVGQPILPQWNYTIRPRHSKTQ